MDGIFLKYPLGLTSSCFRTISGLTQHVCWVLNPESSRLNEVHYLCEVHFDFDQERWPLNLCLIMVGPLGLTLSLELGQGT